MDRQTQGHGVDRQTQGHADTGTHGQTDAGTHGHRDMAWTDGDSDTGTWTRGQTDTGTQTLRHRDTWTLGHLDTQSLGHRDIWTLVHSDTGALGHVDTRAQGHADTGTLRHRDTDTGTLGHTKTQTDRQTAGRPWAALTRHPGGSECPAAGAGAALCLPILLLHLGHSCHFFPISFAALGSPSPSSHAALHHSTALLTCSAAFSSSVFNENRNILRQKLLNL